MSDLDLELLHSPLLIPPSDRITLAQVEKRRLQTALQTAAPHKAALGQYLTPAPIARFMASLFTLDVQAGIRLLDAGAGQGILTAALLDRWLEESEVGNEAYVCTYERDLSIRTNLDQTLNDYLLRATLMQRSLRLDSRYEDFIEDAAHLLLSGESGQFSHIILNPPYKKIQSKSPERLLLRQVGLETVNLYSAFVGLAVMLLQPGGELVAIIPRSFCNGPYYRPFRELLLRETAILHIHLFESRNKAFQGDAVLQENLILYLRKSLQTAQIRISTSSDPTFTDYVCREIPVSQVISPHDAEQFIHIPSQNTLENVTEVLDRYTTLAQTDLEVSTGPIVDFRLKSHLRKTFSDQCAPLLYPSHFSAGHMHWPLPNTKKYNAIEYNSDTQKWLFPKGFYTVVRRFSAKEERKRLVASVVSPEDLPSDWIGFENHLNVFHIGRQGISEELAYGLAAWLNSTALDNWFRRFSGHTQVNATDLRMLRYPSREILETIGAAAMSLKVVSQVIIDALIEPYL